MTVIHLRDRSLVPWKNGMGKTREIITYPAGSDISDFVWRVSIAEVDSASPFSTFDGIDRHIVLLDGAGFDMHLNGAHTHALRHRYEPFSFRGELRVTITLLDGATRDFNLMTRRDHAQGHISVLRGPLSMHAPSDIALLYVAHGAIQIDEKAMSSGDAWTPSIAASTILKIPQHSVVLAVHIVVNAV